MGKLILDQLMGRGVPAALKEQVGRVNGLCGDRSSICVSHRLPGTVGALTARLEREQRTRPEQMRKEDTGGGTGEERGWGRRTGTPSPLLRPAAVPVRFMLPGAAPASPYPKGAGVRWSASEQKEVTHLPSGPPPRRPSPFGSGDTLQTAPCQMARFCVPLCAL